MKKLFAALTLMMFVGSVSATVYAVASGNTIEIKNQDDKKKKNVRKVMKNLVVPTRKKKNARKVKRKNVVQRKQQKTNRIKKRPNIRSFFLNLYSNWTVI